MLNCTLVSKVKACSLFALLCIPSLFCVKLVISRSPFKLLRSQTPFGVKLISSHSLYYVPLCSRSLQRMKLISSICALLCIRSLLCLKLAIVSSHSPFGFAVHSMISVLCKATQLALTLCTVVLPNSVWGCLAHTRSTHRYYSISSLSEANHYS